MFVFFILSPPAQRTQFLLDVQLVLPPYAMQSGDLTIQFNFNYFLYI